jgi:hypothetical protein
MAEMDRPPDDPIHMRRRSHYLALARTHRERAAWALDRDSVESHMTLADECKALAQTFGES